MNTLYFGWLDNAAEFDPSVEWAILHPGIMNQILIHLRQCFCQRKWVYFYVSSFSRTKFYFVFFQIAGFRASLAQTSFCLTVLRSTLLEHFLVLRSDSNWREIFWIVGIAGKLFCVTLHSLCFLKWQKSEVRQLVCVWIINCGEVHFVRWQSFIFHVQEILVLFLFQLEKRNMEVISLLGARGLGCFQPRCWGLARPPRLSSFNMYLFVQVFMPTAVIVMLSWSVFWADMDTGSQVKTHLNSQRSGLQFLYWKLVYITP